MRPYKELAKVIDEGQSVRMNGEVITTKKRLAEAYKAQNEPQAAEAASAADDDANDGADDADDPEQEPANGDPARAYDGLINHLENQELPAEFPGRSELIAAGYTTLDEVSELTRDELLALDGIGPATADKVIAAAQEPNR